MENVMNLFGLSTMLLDFTDARALLKHIGEIHFLRERGKQGWKAFAKNGASTQQLKITQRKEGCLCFGGLSTGFWMAIGDRSCLSSCL